MTRLALPVGAAAAAPVLALLPLLGTVGSDMTTVGSRCGINVEVTRGAAALKLSAEQAGNARAIADVARRSELPQRALAVALMTAQQESGLINLSRGDRDSLGLFQQRPSQGWGEPSQLLDPRYAAAAFFARLLEVHAWAARPMWEVAQEVQRSADGRLYAAYAPFGEALATGLMGSGRTLSCLAPTTASPANRSRTAASVLAYAQSQLSKPYIWGASGPDGFDCSGLTQRAYEAAGIGLPRTSEQQWLSAPQIPASRLAPGDLVFFNPGQDGVPGPGHVGIYVGAGMMINAPNPSSVVRYDSIYGFGTYVGATRPA